MSELRARQEWLRDVITGERDASRADLDAVVRSTSRLSASQRLDLYRRSYRLRLLEVMRAGYPGLRHMLGPELFDEFALDYLHARPSRTYTLQRLGEGFADHLAANRPDADGVPEAWPDLIIDLAHLERTFAEVHDGPGVEGEELPAAADVPAEPDGGWLTAEPVPCLRLVRSSFPAGPYLAAVRRGEDPPLPVPAESFVAVSRRDWVVTLTPLDARSYELLDGLMHGARVDADAWGLVRDWAGRGFLSNLGVKEQVTQ